MIQILNQLHWHLPGQRIVKTGIAVTACLLFYTLIGYEAGSLPAEGAITAIICVQPYVNGSRESGLNRLMGTLIGAMCGFLFLLGVSLYPALGTQPLLLYPMMGVGTLLALHAAVLLGRSDASGLAAIVFICVVIAWPEIANPVRQSFLRILDVMLGTCAAVIINSVHLPRVKQPNKVFFIPMDALTDNRFSRLGAPVLFRLQSLLQEGAGICLMSRHAPAFQTFQLGASHFSVPMIVMDGAAIYDPNENVYLSTTNLPGASCRWLMKRLEEESYFIYTVHRDRNCIFHHGELTELERALYRSLKRSPYRYYLDNDHFAVADVVYIKLITTAERADRLQRELAPMLEKMKLRSVLRPPVGPEEGCSLYFYAEHADWEHAKAHVMQLLRQKNPAMEPSALPLDRPYRSDADAARLLQEVAVEYEPLLLTELWKKRRARLRHAMPKSRPLPAARH